MKKKGSFKINKTLRNGLMGIIVSLLHGIASIILTKTPYSNLLIYHYVFAILAFLLYGFIIGILIKPLLDKLKLEYWLKNGIFGIIYTIIFSVVISLTTYNLINAGFYGFIVMVKITLIQWSIPLFIFGIIAGYIIKKLER